MCGIAGYLVRRSRDENVVRQMVDALIHRGPDSSSFHRSGPYSAGMRRLKINDLSTGDQPLYNSDRSVVMFYNGEIYNSPQLRKTLESKGVRFRTHSDGEVICHLYELYGEKLFSMLDGMFAVALWDERSQKLILARDVPGEKPLYYYQLSDSEVVFASEIKGLKQFPGLDLSVDLQAVWDFPTFSWIPEPDTIFKRVKALMPGTIMVIDSKGTRIESIPNAFEDGDLNERSSEEDWIAGTHRVVTEVIESRLLSDVPVGSFLSGGLDSSIITAVAQRKLGNLSTFTIGFEEADDFQHGKADESPYAEQFAKQLGTRHHTIRVSSGDFRNLLSDFSFYGDQPFAVSSALGIMAVAKEARASGIKVLLSGDGADESFGGYSWYAHLKQSPGQMNQSNDCKVSYSTLNLSRDQKLEVLNQYSPQERALAWHYYASEFEKKNIFSPELFEGVQKSVRFFHEYQARFNWGPSDFIRQDRQFYFPNEMLHKLDRMTMAYSVEGRAPFAAPRILSLAEKLNYGQQVKGGELKWVLKRAFESLLPEAIIQRPKHGFNVPLDHWFRTEWADLIEEALSPGSELDRLGMLGPDSLGFVKGMIAGQEKVIGHTLLSLVMLNRWAKEQ